MRCPDCNRFVGTDSDTEPEIDLDIDDKGQISGTVRIVNTCAECGAELSEASFDVDAEIEAPEEHEGEDHELSIDDDGGERTCNQIGKGRGLKTFYGFTATCLVSCSCGKVIKPVEISDEIQASYMDEMN